MRKSTRGPKPKDISGQKFNMLTPTGYEGFGVWICKCDCGETTSAHGADIRRGKVKSCGCLQRDFAKSGKGRRTHGMSHTPEYRSWAAMINRCTNPKAKGYENYGGRGISVCEEWLESPEAFVRDMGKRPRGTSIDRINNDGNYEPDNCRWADNFEQAANQRMAKSVTLLVHDGQSKTVKEWSEETGINKFTIRARLERGWSVEKALTTPARTHNRW